MNRGILRRLTFNLKKKINEGEDSELHPRLLKTEVCVYELKD